MRTRVTESGEPSGDVRFCLVFPRESLSVPVMRRVLGDTLRQLGVDEASISDLLLAVTEACTNVLRHAGPGRRYEVIAEVGRNRCLVEVLDSGRGFDPASLPGRRPPSRPSARTTVRLPARSPARLRRRLAAPSSSPSSSPASHAPVPLLGRLSRARRLAAEHAIAQLPESGRGLAIMRACVDDVTLRSGPGKGTVVSMRKRIEWRPGAPLGQLPESRLRDAG
jgi:anti-sigma regulatory factor (Ser/Thr protein kinase)